MEKISVVFDKGISRLTMATDEANRFDLESFTELEQKLATETARDDVRVLVLESAAPGVFSQGLNLQTLAGLTNTADIERFLGLFYSILHKVCFFPAPVIAAVNGHAIGYGAMLALASDYRLMADSGARIGLPEIKLGIRVPLFVCRLLENAVGHDRALKHIYDGMPWKSTAAHEIGLIDELHAAEKLTAAAQKIAQRLAGAPAQAMRAMKKAMRHQLQEEAAAMLKIDIAETRASIETADAREGIAAAIAGRRPQFKVA